MQNLVALLDGAARGAELAAHRYLDAARRAKDLGRNALAAEHYAHAMAFEDLLALARSEAASLRREDALPAKRQGPKITHTERPLKYVQAEAVEAQRRTAIALVDAVLAARAAGKPARAARLLGMHGLVLAPPRPADVEAGYQVLRLPRAA